MKKVISGSVISRTVIRTGHLFTVLLFTVSLITFPSRAGQASWYGEEHRGRLMANRERFNPDALTCASWFHPLGTRLRVTRADGIPGSVEVVVTDRGPHRRLVRQGRVIDLSRAAYARIDGLEMGLCAVKLQVIRADPTVSSLSPLTPARDELVSRRDSVRSPLRGEGVQISPVYGTRAGNGATEKRPDAKRPLEPEGTQVIQHAARVSPASCNTSLNPVNHPSPRVSRGDFAASSSFSTLTPALSLLKGEGVKP